MIEPYGPLQTIGNEFKKAFSSLAFAWIWVPLIILARPHRSEFAIIRLRHVLVFSVLVYVIFFLIGLGTASEARYWVMPITLTTILGNNAIHVLHSRCRAEWRKYVIAIMLVLVGANAYSAIYAFFNGTEGGTTLVSHATLLQGLSHDLNVERSALLNSREAIYYWSVDPSKRVVGLDDKYVMTLDHESAKRLFDTYDIQMALYPSHVADFLENFGFKEVCREGDWVLLQR